MQVPHEQYRGLPPAAGVNEAPDEPEELAPGLGVQTRRRALRMMVAVDIEGTAAVVIITKNSAFGRRRDLNLLVFDLST